MDERFDELTDRAHALMGEHSVPGLALGMLIDGEEHTATLGVTSLDNPLDVDDHTLFQIGSTTKTVTATVLVRLAEGGYLSLDDRVRRHIAELELCDEDVARTITVRRLLNHTGGFAGDLFTDTGQGDDALARYVEAMRDLPQQIAPGNIAIYNNAGFGLAGRVIEKVTGQTYEQAAKELVLEPLGLRDSMFHPAEVMLRRFVVGHTVHHDGRVVVARPWELPRASMALGGLVSTVRDQLSYAKFHMGEGSVDDGTKVLSSESIEEMRTPTSEYRPGVHFGLAWMISHLEGKKVLAHGGRTNGQLSDFWICPELGVAFTSMTNASTGRLLNRELTEFAQELFLGYRAPGFEPIAVEDPNEFVGRYRGEPNHDVYEVRFEDGELVFQEIDPGRFAETFDRSAESTPSVIEFETDSAFKLRGGDSHGSVGEFWRDDDGKINHMRVSRLLIKE